MNELKKCELCGISISRNKTKYCSDACRRRYYRVKRAGRYLLVKKKTSILSNAQKRHLIEYLIRCLDQTNRVKLHIDLLIVFSEFGITLK